MLKRIVILGAGGYAQEVAWIIDGINERCPEWELVGFVDTGHCGKKEHYGHAVLSGYDAVSALYFVCGMGAPVVRRREAAVASERGWRAATLVHPSVIRARFVSIGEGTTVGPGSVLCPNARLGAHCLINVHASIGHDASVGDYSVVSPGARILGKAVLEEQVMVGANASIYPGCRVGAGATVGANSFLHKDLAAGQSAIGVVAKVFF